MLLSLGNIFKLKFASTSKIFYTHLQTESGVAQTLNMAVNSLAEKIDFGQTAVFIFDLQLNYNYI
ncbi:hypothetical protein NIES3585_22530 [Nodularia sp. NIES-3585]|nr:hypothetical protein NIES3585_22530 [Nodularia sp. NIES-3585]